MQNDYNILRRHLVMSMFYCHIAHRTDSNQLGTPVLCRHFTCWCSIASERSRQQSAWHTTLTFPSLCQLATGACKQGVHLVELYWHTINIRWLRFQVLTMTNINDIWSRVVWDTGTKILQGPAASIFKDWIGGRKFHQNVSISLPNYMVSHSRWLINYCPLEAWVNPGNISPNEEFPKKPRVFENMVLRRIFGPRRDEVKGDWRRLRNEELNDLYSSPNIMRVIKWRRMRWAGHVACMGEERGVYRVLVGKRGKETTGET